MSPGPILILLAVTALGGAWGYAAGARPAEPAPAAHPAAPPAVSRAAQAGRPAARTPARDLFVHACGTCHALRAAATRGLTGPDLDRLRPTTARVLRMVRTGSLDGIMQPGLLGGRDARRVARFVARAVRR